MRRIVFIFITVVLFVACSDKGNEPKEEMYAGITTTDDTGLVLSIVDDDWCYDKDSITTGSKISAKLIPTEFSFYPAYPNPCSTEVRMQFGVPAQTYIEFYLKSNDRKTVFSLLKTFEAGYYELLIDVEPAPAGIYRCYMNAGDFSCYGDIQIVK